MGKPDIFQKSKILEKAVKPNLPADFAAVDFFELTARALFLEEIYNIYTNKI